MWQQIVDYLVYWVVRVLICLVQAVRIETGQRIARGLAWLFCDVLRIRAAVVDDNLAHAFPEMSAVQRAGLARRMWEHLFLLVLEVAHTPRKIHDTNWRDYVRLVNEQQLIRDLFDDRPLLLVTAHLGNFEVGGYVLGILGFPTYTVARLLDNPYLDRFIERFRGGTGQKIIPKSGGYDQILDVLAQRWRDDPPGRPVCGPQRLLGGVLRPTGFGPQGHRLAGVGARRAGLGFRLAAAGPSDAVRVEQFRHDRPAEAQRLSGHGPRLDAVVHRAAGRADPPIARSVLVASPALERYAGEEAGKTRGGVVGY